MGTHNEREPVPITLVTTDNTQYDFHTEDGPMRLTIGEQYVTVEWDDGYHLIPWHQVQHINFEYKDTQ